MYYQRKLVMEHVFPLWQKRYGGVFEESTMVGRMQEAKELYVARSSTFSGVVADRLIISRIPKERLLVFQVQEGWKPLCEFLDVPIPDEPFPRLNDTANMEKIFKKSAQVVSIL